MTLRIMCLVAVVLAYVPSSSHSESSQTSEPVSLAKGGNRNGIEAELAIRRFHFDGDTLVACLVVRNTGATKQYSFQNGYAPWCKAVLRDEHGATVPLTVFGRNVLTSTGTGQGAKVVFKPGEAKTWYLDLAACFEITKGTYKLNLEVESYGTLQLEEPAHVVLRDVSVEVLGDLITLDNDMRMDWLREAYKSGQKGLGGRLRG